MLGYLLGKKVGAIVCNAAHALVVPLALLSIGRWVGSDLAGSIACAWVAHIGFNRCIGYGLKYSSAFKHTHLSWQDRQLGLQRERTLSGTIASFLNAWCSPKELQLFSWATFSNRETGVAFAENPPTWPVLLLLRQAAVWQVRGWRH